MRIIKFRAWDKETMGYAPMLGYTENVDINEQIRCSIANGTVLMQYTGLKDKNGKEIYEGDILKNQHGTLGKMSWFQHDHVDKSGFQIAFFNFNGFESLNQWEIIGNIYENPDLLTPKQDE